MNALGSVQPIAKLPTGITGFDVVCSGGLPNGRNGSRWIPSGRSSTTSVTEAHISTITDSVILLRHVEMYGEMRRGLTVLKMRGSMHDKDIRELTINHQGMHIGRAFRDVTGILASNPRHMSPGAVDRVGERFKES